MMAGIIISQDDVIDVEFETVASGDTAMSASFARHERYGPSLQGADQLSLLRDQFSGQAKSSHPDNLTPAFLIATLICAFVVFWVSGGHALLY